MSLATRSYRSAPAPRTRRSSSLGAFSLGPFVPPAPPPDADALPAALSALASVAALFAAPPLSSAERSELGGAVFRAAPALSHQLAAALLGDPARYSAQAAAAEALREQQAQADDWLQLREALGRLFALAGDEYLRAQGACTRAAIDLIARIPPQERGGLRAAHVVLAAHRAACAPARPRRRPAAPPTARAQDARRERRRAALDAGLRSFYLSLLRCAAAPVPPPVPAPPVSGRPAPAPPAPAPVPASTAAGRPTMKSSPPSRCTQGPGAEIPASPALPPERKPAKIPGSLNRLFQRHFHLTAPSPPCGSAVAEPSATQLPAIEADAAAQARRTPPPFLSEAQRRAFAQKRSPLLAGILRQCALGFAAAPDFAKELSVTPQVCENIARVDDATTQLIEATADVYRVGAPDS